MQDFDVVLSTALASRCRWVKPYEHTPGIDLVDPGGERGASWGADLRRVLRSTERTAGSIIRTKDIGDVIVHRQVTEDGLHLTSLRAMPDVAPGRVLAATYALATGTEFHVRAERVSPFDLPLGAHPLWEITEDRTWTPGREETYDVRVPCWEVTTSHDLGAPDNGFDAIAGSVLRLLDLPKIRVRCVQASTARYSRTGFEAAAVSTGGFLGRSMKSASEEGVRRTVTLRFNRPYAVVAVATLGPRAVVSADDPTPRLIWHGVPVFAAWVAAPAESQEEDFEWDAEFEW